MSLTDKYVVPPSVALTIAARFSITIDILQSIFSRAHRRATRSYFPEPASDLFTQEYRDFRMSPYVDRGAPTPEELRETLNSVCASDAFKKSRRMRELLHYLVEAALLKPGTSVSAEEIATNVFGRKAGSIEHDDPLVRTNMSRLRSALIEHYSSPGCLGKFELCIPQRQYLLEVSPRKAPRLPLYSRTAIMCLISSGMTAAVLILTSVLIDGSVLSRLYH